MLSAVSLQPSAIRSNKADSYLLIADNNFLPDVVVDLTIVMTIKIVI